MNTVNDYNVTIIHNMKPYHQEILVQENPENYFMESD